MRRWFPLLLMGVLLSACGQRSTACTMMGGVESLTITLAPAARSELDTLRVDIRQAKVHRTIAFPVGTRSEQPMAEVPGILRGPHGRYTLLMGGDSSLLDALPGPWSPSTRVHLTVEGLTANRLITYRHREIFAFRRFYPNGRHCGGRSLLHATTLGTKDKLAVPSRAPKRAPYTREMLAPINRQVIEIAARLPGFIAIKDDLPHLRVTVTWAGRAPNQLKKYAASWPGGVRVVIVEQARP
jgi:hypothetical protein